MYGRNQNKIEKMKKHKANLPVFIKIGLKLVLYQVLCIRGSRKLWKHKLDMQEAEVMQCVSNIRE